MPGLKEKYVKEIAPSLKSKFNYKSVMEVPKLEKVILNMGIGDAKEDPKALDAAVNDMMLISGQSLVPKAKSLLQLKLRRHKRKVTLEETECMICSKLLNVALQGFVTLRSTCKFFDGKKVFMGVKSS